MWLGELFQSPPVLLVLVACGRGREAGVKDGSVLCGRLTGGIFLFAPKLVLRIQLER